MASDDSLRISEMPSLIQPAGRFAQYLRQTIDLVEIARASINDYEGIAAMAEQIRSGGKVSESPDGWDQDPPSGVAVARQEIEQDFPLLHAHSIVGMWGAFEAWIEDMAEEWIVITHDTLNWDRVASKIGRDALPIPLVAALNPDKRTVARQLRIALQEANRGASGLAVAQGVLKPLGLGVAVPAGVRENIHDLEQVRHVYAHTAGIADTDFVTRCPNLGLSVGDRVRVGHDQFHAFAGALHKYVYAVARKAGEWYPSEESHEPEQAAIDDELQVADSAPGGDELDGAV